jgi:3-mercaptopyruvate sulfurtransferase SseA
MRAQSIERNELLIEPSDLMNRLQNPNFEVFDATVATNQVEGEPSAMDNYLAGHIPGAAFLNHQGVGR